MIYSENVNYESGNIVPESGYEAIAEKVLSGETIVVLKNVFKRGEMIELRDKVFEWAVNKPIKVENTDSFHRIDNNPPKSECKHIFHMFDFNMDNRKEIFGLTDVLRSYAQKMRFLQNRLAGTNSDFTAKSNDNLRMHLQLIQYPKGGGYFNEHQHPFEPQRLGLITGVSQMGKEFNQGSTWFRLKNGTEVSIEDEHCAGDIALFRYDLPHGVTAIDPDNELNWDDPNGRWTMVLPYN